MDETEEEVVVTLPFLGELTYREIHAVEEGSTVVFIASGKPST